jgi:hypothetical protein
VTPEPRTGYYAHGVHIIGKYVIVVVFNIEVDLLVSLSKGK